MKLTLEHSHPWMCLLPHVAKVLFHDATNLQYQILLIATVIDHEVSQLR